MRETLLKKFNITFWKKLADGEIHVINIDLHNLHTLPQLGVK
ncbi:6441_t:CDS:2 [Gigaspora rosea]|nr:6441_t:CDS:2 [Gigaspora rosea]